MLGSANLGPSVFWVFIASVSNVARLLQNLIHVMPQHKMNILRDAICFMTHTSVKIRDVPPVHVGVAAVKKCDPTCG